LELGQAHQDASTGSDEYNLRPLEILAVTFANLAIEMFKQYHPNDGPHEEITGPGTMPALEHPQYNNYPNDAAEMVGYFGETMVLDRVVLVDRGEVGSSSARSSTCPLPLLTTIE